MAVQTFDFLLLFINDSIGLDLERGLDMEVTRFSELFSTEETKEGLSAFVEKRKPDFR